MDPLFGCAIWSNCANLPNARDIYTHTHKLIHKYIYSRLKKKLEKLNLERQKLIDEVNAPLKRKAILYRLKCQTRNERETSRARKNQSQNCRSQNWSRQNLHRNISSQRCLTFSKKFETSKIPAFSNGKKTLINMFSNDVYYRKIFWFRCCLRTNYSGIFR